MKKFFYFFLNLILLSSGFYAYSQNNPNKFSISTRNLLMDFYDAGLKNNSDVFADKKLFSKYALFNKNDIIYASGLIKVDSEIFIPGEFEAAGGIISSSLGDILSVRIPVNNITKLENMQGVKYVELGQSVFPDLDGVLIDTKVDSVHNGFGLPQSYTGKGVVIAVTDWGFDYSHPVFYDSTQTNLRISRVWDQYRNAGPPPAGFTYGTEIIGQSQLLQAAHDTFNVYGNHTHGTHVASIAGGSGAGTKYNGVAPEAELVFVSILVDEASVMDAYLYVAEYAKSVNKRLVVNMSWGLYHMGTLDGSSLLSELLDSLSQQGVVFASSAGNNGDVDFHIKKNFIDNQDTLKTRIEFDNWSGAYTLWGSAIICWGEENNPFRAALEITNSSNVQLFKTNFFNTVNCPAIDTFFNVGTDTVYYKIIAEDSNANNGKPHMLIKIRNTNLATHKVNLNMIADGGNVHLWNVAELQNGVGNWGLAFTAPYTGFVSGDNEYGIGEPSCTESVISVAAYKTERVLSNGNHTGGALASFSSRGPTVDERMKPDITAPGVSVVSAMSSYYSGSYFSATSVAFNGRTYKFAALSGTSMSGPVVAGVAALILQANPWLSPFQVKEIIKNTARTDNFTGVIPSSGSASWGMGKINALEAVKYAVNNFAGVERNNDVFNHEMLVFPNPAKDKVFIMTDDKQYLDEIAMYDSNGKLIKSEKIIYKSEIYEMNINDINPGYYIIILKYHNMFKNARLIKY